MAEEEKAKRKWTKNVTDEPDDRPYRAAEEPERARNDKNYKGGSVTSYDHTRTKDYQKALVPDKTIRKGFYGKD